MSLLVQLANSVALSTQPLTLGTSEQQWQHNLVAVNVSMKLKETVMLGSPFGLKYISDSHFAYVHRLPTTTLHTTPESNGRAAAAATRSCSG